MHWRGGTLLPWSNIWTVKVVSYCMFFGWILLVDNQLAVKWMGFFSSYYFRCSSVFQKMVIQTKSVEYMPLFLSLASLASGICWTAYALIEFDLYITVSHLSYSFRFTSKIWHGACQIWLRINDVTFKSALYTFTKMLVVTSTNIRTGCERNHP